MLRTAHPVKSITQLHTLLALTLTLFSGSLYAGQDKNLASDWQKTLEEARGQTVYFNAWGGSQTINAYIQWDTHICMHTSL